MITQKFFWKPELRTGRASCTNDTTTETARMPCKNDGEKCSLELLLTKRQDSKEVAMSNEQPRSGHEP